MGGIDTVLTCDLGHLREQVLVALPAAGLIDHEPVLGEGSIGQSIGGLVLPQPASREEAASQAAVAHHRPRLPLQIRHQVSLRSSVQQRVLHLVRGHDHSGLFHLPQPCHVEVRSPYQTNLARRLQLAEPAHDLHVSRHVVVPPGELHEIESLGTETAQRSVDGRGHRVAIQVPQRIAVGHVLGVHFQPVGPVPESRAEPTEDRLHPGVDVGAIERVKPRLEVPLESHQRVLVAGGYALMPGRKLPEPDDMSRHLVTGREVDPRNPQLSRPAERPSRRCDETCAFRCA